MLGSRIRLKKASRFFWIAAFQDSLRPENTFRGVCLSARIAAQCREQILVEPPAFSLDTATTSCYTISMTRMGRPKKAASERQSHLIALRLKPAELKSLDRAAAKAKLSVSDYIRQKLDLRSGQ
jgi:hypothetical protein